MKDSAPPELELTPELLEYARGVALSEAKIRCPKYVVYDDVAQEAVLHLMSTPPKYDPSRGASQTTLIHLAVQRFVLKYIACQCRHADHYEQIEESPPEPDDEDDNPRVGSSVARSRMFGLIAAERADDAGPQRASPEHHPKENTTKHSTTDDVLEFIDDEGSRELCRVVMECQGNMSEAARRLGHSEGTVRYRLKLLAPKLLAAGFNPFSNEECG